MAAGWAGAFAPDETPDWLSRRAERSPGALGLLAEGHALDYRALDALASQAAGNLERLGVSPGDRVAALLPSGVHFAALLHGVLRRGAALVPLNTRLTAGEIGFILDDAAPKALVLSERYEELGGPLAAARGLPVLRVGSFGTAPDALLDGPARHPEPARLSDLAALVYTSGTTGRPKGAMLTRGNFYHAAVTSALGLGTLPGDRWLLCMPLFHVGGMSILLRATLYGIAVVAQDGFSPNAVHRAIEREGVTIASLVPTMLQRMLDRREGRAYPAGLRYVLLGGGPAARDLLQRAVAEGVPIAPTYGLTETASQAATLPPAEVADHLGAAGRPLFLTEIRIQGEGRPLPPGATGEILVRGPTVTKGYWRRPAATKAALEGGYLRTGDLGYLDAQGYLFVLDRRDDLIVSGGENVYPAEIEDALLHHPAVLDAGVYPLADDVFGQVPAAAVVLRQGAAPDAEEILAFLRQRLAGYKLPRLIRFMSELPRNAGGKLMRRLLRPEEDPR